ncbi:MAG TPA: hypothetical protein GX507_04315 [Clostridia bacterium]|nr:hypothetical protein [Clostridia bacterium]
MRSAIFEYIEAFYNCRRRIRLWGISPHSSSKGGSAPGGNYQQ